MNKQLFRLVFNKARGLLMAVAESAASHSLSAGSTRRRQPAFAGEDNCFALRPAELAIVLFVTGTVGLAPYAQAQIVGDPAAAANQRPIIGTASNGVPLVNIQTPSAAGVSRNVYSRFDVQNNGAILNNARSSTQSQLGGWIQGNANLATGTARIILNEVNSSDPSALHGYIEVAGDKAQLVIANPAGITCDGCGFINASRATLTTGTPLINGGSLDGFRVERGQILIQGAGMDASQADYTDLIARSVQINAGLWANSLKITTGANRVNTDNSLVTPISGTGAAAVYAIDVAQLGGMYAGKIHLIGTEGGVGMRNAGTLGASAGEVAITLDGQLVNSGRIAAQGNITVNATSLNNAGAQIQATGNLGLNLGSGNLDNSGGLLRSNGLLSITADNINNRNTQGSDQGIEGQSISLFARNINNNQGAIRADQAISIRSSGSLDNTQGQIASNQTISIADTASTPGLVVTNTGGTMLAGQNLSINVGTLSGDGNLYSLGDLSLRLNNAFNNTGRIVANNDLTVITPGRLTNQSAIQAGNSLTMTAANLDNTGNGEITAFSTYLAVSGTLNNRGLIDGSLTRLFAGTLNNLGSGRIYGDNLAISATTLNNDTENGVSAVIAARNRLDIGAETINNNEHALIFSAGDLAIGSTLDQNSHAIGQARTLNNNSASIEALGNQNISVQQINNTNAHFSTTIDTNSIGITEYQGSGSSTRYLAGTPGVYIYTPDSAQLATPDGNYQTWYAYRYTRTTSDTRILTTDPGQILSGGSITFNANNLLNDKSRIIAGGALIFPSGSVTNTDVSGEHKVTDVGSVTSYWRERYCSERILGVCFSHDYRTGAAGSAYSPSPISQTVSLSPTIYQQYTTPTGSGTQIAALSTGNVGSIPSSALPNNALFHQNPSPSASYLIESDARFANYRTWIGSDYMLQQLSIDPTTAQKRLGDGFYEQKLLREEIAQLTGRRFLDGYASDEAEYRALMDKGVTQSKAWGLIPGVALSAAQVAQLTSDIVWLIERDVTLANGTTQKVLAPQLYLAPRSGDLLPSGALISADSLKLNLTGDLINSGTIAGRQLVSLAANNIKNLGGVIRGDSVALAAQTDLDNQGGRIEAVNSLELQAGRDITVASTTRTQSTAQGSRTNIDRVAGLYVTGGTGTLTAIAGRDASFNGATINNAGNGATTLAATNNLNLGAITESNQLNIAFDGSNHINTANSRDAGSQIRTQGDLALIAGNDITAKAVNIQTTGNVALTAGNDVTILAGQGTQTIDEATLHKSKGDGLLGKRRIEASQFQQEQNTVVGSQLTGQNVTVQSGRDTNLEASQFNAQDQLKLASGRDINIVSAEQSTSTLQSNSVTKTWGLGKESLKKTINSDSVTQIGSSLFGQNIELTANNNLTLLASRLSSPGNVTLTAGNEINYLAATNLDERHEKVEYKNNLLSFDYWSKPANSWRTSKSTSTTDSSTRTAAVSQIQSEADVLSQSGGNTTLQGTRVSAGSFKATAGMLNGEVVNPNAQLLIEGVKESSSTSSSKKSSSFMYQHQRSSGENIETLKLPEIEITGSTGTLAKASPTLNGTGGVSVGAAALPTTQFEAKKGTATGGGGEAPTTRILDLRAEAATLAQKPGLAWLGDLTKRNDVDWKKVELIHQQWDHKQSGLTQEGGIVIAIVVAILTWGIGSGLAGATESAATTTTTQVAVDGAVSTTATTSVSGMTLSTVTTTTAVDGTVTTATSYGALGAALNAGFTTLATQATTSLINNKGDIGKTLEDLGKKESVKQLVASMLTAGVTQGVAEHLQDNGILSKLTENSGFAERFTNYATRATVAAGIQSAVYGKPLSETTKTALINSLAQTLTSEIGDWDKKYGMEPGSLAKTLAHAVVQCASASIQNGDCGSAALGAAVAETLSPALNKLDASTKEAGYQQTFGSAIAGMSALLVASLTGKDPATAMNAAQMVDYYNRQLHPDERKWAKDNAARYKNYFSSKTGEDISLEEAYQRLLSAGYARVDDLAGKLAKSDPIALQFIAESAPQALFTATAAERMNHLLGGNPDGSWTPEQQARFGKVAPAMQASMLVTKAVDYTGIDCGNNSLLCQQKFEAIDRAIGALKDARPLYQDDPGSIVLIDRQIAQLLAGIKPTEVARGASVSISDTYKNIAAFLVAPASRMLIAGTTIEAADRVALTQAIRDIRMSLPSDAKNSGNVAIASIEIDGLPSQMAASSQVDKASTIVVGKGSENFKAVNLGDNIPRTSDSEYKILDNIADKLGSNTSATGSIKIITERAACDSCLNVAQQFRAKYPNIDLKIFDNNNVALLPKGTYPTKSFDPNRGGIRK